ncbi:alpha/beta hydrolase [Dokdonia sp. Hel_I_53]|uniref:alpha/beta hydrolase n=1 Tax=Dokdonia sp. Hel_I_53 TaxID=1566287 RepID=UPI001199B64F|nr:alpha/beta hydrolase [Dokdonia sp. Hel_I_53]TVZ51665.1 pimeloyl-ACP methyl ester carboxylesterase [Dokdonia sp. Hel_I_53]
MKKTFQKFLPRAIGAKINTISLYDKKKASKIAFNIFCTPRAGKVSEEQEAYLKGAKSIKLKTSKNELQSYHWPGKGKKVLLIHGWESNTYRWHLLIKDLKERDYDIYAIDAPAHGHSKGNILYVTLYAEAIQSAVQAFKPEMIVAHSIGSLATIFHNFHYKNTDLSKIVLLGPASELSEIMSDYQKILRLNERTMKALEKLVVKRFGFNFKDFSGAAFAKAIKTPTLLIHDKFDRITPIEASRAIHKNITNSKLIETEGFGHSLYQQEVRDEILKFIEH